MKRLFLSFLFGASLLAFSQAQEQNANNFCGTAPGKSEWLKQYQNNLPQYEHLRGKAMIYMPMTVTILTNDNGTSASYSVHAVLEEICQLNEDYKSANIYFFLASPIRFIASTKWNNHKTYEENEGLYDNNVENTINTYYATNAAGNCGYDYPGTGIVLAKGCMGPTSHTWAHEMGHELSLPHTFSGWEGITFNPSKPLPEILIIKTYDKDLKDTIVNMVTPEKIDKSNCKDTGDGFCDTPPDYISYRWTCATNGKSTNEYKDPNGAPFRTDGTYYMSYSQDACMNRFSGEQMEAMRTNCLSQKLEFVNTALDIKEIKDTVALIAPAPNAIIKSDSITLSWSKVPNASHYYVEMALDKKFSLNAIRKNIETNSITMPIVKGKTYYWRVRPYNLAYTCDAPTLALYRSFMVENASSVVDINGLSSISVFPNPIQSDGTLKVKVNAKSAGSVKLSLNDLLGRKIAQQNIFLNEGENDLDFPIGTLSSGLYLIQLDAPVGSVQRKITVY